MEKPEDYRWNSLGYYHIQSGNKDGFLSTDFGPVKYAPLSLRELHRASLKKFNVKSEKERVRLYRKYVYEAGAIQPGDKPFAKTIDQKVVAKEGERISRSAARIGFVSDAVFYGFGDHRVAGVCGGHLPAVQAFVSVPAGEETSVGKGVGGGVFVEKINRTELATIRTDTTRTKKRKSLAETQSSQD